MMPKEKRVSCRPSRSMLFCRGVLGVCKGQQLCQAPPGLGPQPALVWVTPHAGHQVTDLPRGLQPLPSEGCIVRTPCSAPK